MKDNYVLLCECTFSIVHLNKIKLLRFSGKRVPDFPDRETPWPILDKVNHRRTYCYKPPVIPNASGFSFTTETYSDSEL